MSKYKVVVTDDRHKAYEEEKQVLSGIGAELTIACCTTPEEVSAACEDADGVLVNLAPVNADVVGKLKKCRIISRYGVGFDNVDVAACTKKGIYVANVADYCAEEVSDHALALLLACIRKVVLRDTKVRMGQWDAGRNYPIRRISGKTFAFLGFGKIAQCLLRKIAGMNFARILVYDPYADEETVKSLKAEKTDLYTAVKEADYISVHMPLNESTRGIINRDLFSVMKTSAILINTSRGAVIDEKSLIEALNDGMIDSAGLDVYSSEPPDPDSPLYKLDNCVLTDHVAWYSEESVRELKIKAAQNVRSVLLGGLPEYPVNRIDI